MDAVALTADLVASTYHRMTQTLTAARRRHCRPFTLADKYLLGHLADPESEELVPGVSSLSLRPDRVIFQDVLAQTGMLQFMQTGRDRVAVPTTIHCDHLTVAQGGARADLRASLAEHDEVYVFLQRAAARFGAGFWGPGAGIMHQVVLEHYAFPGELLIGTDSHTPNAGGLGACAVGVGGLDAVEVIAGLPWDLLYPRRIAIVLTGTLGGWAAPKDIILHLAGILGTSGGTNAILEYIGPGARTISATGKATIANMGAELGATTSLFPLDSHMLIFLEATGRGALIPLIEQHWEILKPDAAVEDQPSAHYDRVVEIDLARLEPYVAGPHTPDRVRPVSAFAAELRQSGGAMPTAISAALIGSCTNSSYEDMSRAASIAEQAIAHGVGARVPLLITPGSEQVRATLERDGQLAALDAIKGSVLANACGPCIGQWKRDPEVASTANSIVTSYNRNFPRRNDGQASTMNFIASPEIVVALALAGTLSFNPLTDSLMGGDGRPFVLAPPGPAPEVPDRRYIRGDAAYRAPAEDGRNIDLDLSPSSERLQPLAPWPAWDGADFTALPVLIKARGKTTTDAISPAGHWLRYRGHLDRCSDNLFGRAINAYTGEVGLVTNVLTGERDRPAAAVARFYRSRALRWIAVGDYNYGEGSSREHAALSPRLLGAAAVIARSFARIHESNLKKQGILALTFQDVRDYDRVFESDRLSLCALQDLAPGRPVECAVAHADGTTETLQLAHSYSGPQLEWFRSGSALNLCRLVSAAPVAQ